MNHVSCCNRFFICAAFLLLQANVFSQSFQSSRPDSATHFIRTTGAITGFSHTISNNTFYQVYYLAGDLSWSFHRPKKSDFLSFYMEPQFNFVHTDRPLDFELGNNLGLRNYIRITPGFYLYQMLGSGPHYITAKLSRQASGFIFSNNLALGSYNRISKKDLFLNMQFRIRHISNGGIKLPNRGINSYNFMVGLARFHR